MSSVKNIKGVNYIDGARLWNSIINTSAEIRIQTLLKNAGVSFFDDDERIVNKPTVAVLGFGGFPISFEPGGNPDCINIMGVETTPDDLLSSQKTMRGFAGFISNLNTGNQTAHNMDQITTKLGHLSKYKTCVIDLIFLGYPRILEENFRRLSPYVTHGGIVTAARTKVQSNPPLVAMSSAGAKKLKILDNTLAGLRENTFRHEYDNQEAWLDALEEINSFNPANTASLCMLSIDVNNLLATMSDIADKGQELAWRRLLALLNDQMNVLFPELFQNSHALGTSPCPTHWL